MYTQDIQSAVTHSSGFLDTIAADLAIKGWCVYDDFLPDSLTQALSDEFIGHLRNGELRQAGIGRGHKYRINPEQRKDWIKWLDINNATPSQLDYFEAINQLRLSLNRSLYLGIFDYECHMALYPAGGFYKKHFDQFKDKKNRLLTCIIYLNPEWFSTDGGLLRLYTDPCNDHQYEDILPISGRMVTFFSARFAHAVLPCKRNRLSITGFFKTSTPIV